MQESMYKFMKVGIIHFMAYPQTMKGEGPILETLQKIAEDDFFTAVEVSWMKDKEIRKKARKLLKTSHLVVAYGAQPTLLVNNLDMNSLDEQERRKAIQQLKDDVDEAYELGAKALAFLSGKDPGEEKREKALELLVSSTKEICDYAKAKGNLKIALEVFDRDIAKKCLIGQASLAKRYAEMMRKQCANFGLMVDLSHLPLLGESPAEAILPIKDYLVHAHMGNCIVKDKNQLGYGDEHPRFGIEGGENDTDELVEYLKVLMKIGFLNPDNPPIVSFEVKPLPGESSEVVIANAKRTLKEAWARV
ncbi:MAG: Xylose isomerase domain-containing protein TIM barrel [candidate division TA06 bacterium 34_109]|uniref:Xylose isomerase domain-containing protein TIM barrel n=1 Tax=candidate division TA06 bacterium 34_109 TaxID=1635277 RepID=A0A124G048_UNCT6|nr:MAG: Xylose isomerase domain-containing protein TIM barrel [candidate division TA06 bacterium 34_109]